MPCMSKRNLLAVLPVILLMAASCANDMQLHGTWIMDAYSINRNDASHEMDMIWVIHSDGTMEQTITYPGGVIDQNTANWELSDNQLTIHYPHNNTSVLWVIDAFDGERLEVAHTRPGFYVQRGFQKQQ